MEVVPEAGRVDTGSGDGIKMAENPTVNEASEKIGSVGVDSRDRRKSKYLSYPYTNVGPRHKGSPAGSEDLRSPCLSHKAETSSMMTSTSNRTPSVAKLGSQRSRSHKTATSSTTPNALNGTPSGAKLGNKRFRRNWHRKFISCNEIPNSTEFKNASPADLLSGLHSIATDCMSPMEDTSTDLVEWFVCKYRVSKYHDEAELATSMVDVNGENNEKPIENILQDTKTEKRRKYNKRENTVRRKMKSLSGLSDVNTSGSASDFLKPEGKLKRKRKVEEVTPLQQPQNEEIITLNPSNSKHSSVPEIPQTLTSDSPRPVGKKKPKRKVEEVTSSQQPHNVAITLNESNGKNSSVPEGTQISTSDSLRPEGKVKQQRMVEGVTQLQQPQKVEITFNSSNGKHSSVPEVPQISGSNSLRPGGKLKQKRKVEEVTPLQWPQNVEPQNVEITLNGTNGKSGLVPEVPPCIASEQAAHKRRKQMEAAPAPVYQSAQNASVNSGTQITKCSTLVIDLQLISPSIPGSILQKCNGENKEELVLAGSNPESRVSQERLVADFTDHDLSPNTTSKVGTVSASETVLKGKMEKEAEGNLSNKLAAEIPDLNCTVTEPNSTSRESENVNMLSPEVKSEQPGIVSPCEKPLETINCSRVKENEEADGSCLLLRFTPGVHLPSKEDLMSTFFRFGPLKASETKLLKDTCSAQIVFVRSTDARSAFDSLDQSKPFGAAIVDYKLHHFPAACPPTEQRVAIPNQPPTRLTSFMTPTQLKTRSTPMASVAHPPPLHVMKQNLQIMASMLENSGNNLSPEMRTKLDSELKSLLIKVNSRAGSSLQKSES